MNVLRISLLGKFRMQCGEQVLAGFPAPKAQELLGYLLLHRDRPLPREALAGELWCDHTTTQSRKNLRHCLWQLQAALDAHIASSHARLLVTEAEWIQVNPEADLWLDVAVLEQAFARVQSVPVQEMDAEGAVCLRDAVQLYQGDLLEGCYQDWCLYERERLQNMYLTMLDRLMGYDEAHHAYATALGYGARILSYDPVSERTHRRLMRLHYLAGNRTAAMRQYERCATALAEALDARPGKRTLALYEQICGDPSGQPTLAAAQSDPSLAAPDAALGVVIDHLQQLQASLAQLQRQVQQAVHAAHMALSRRR
jgi:DNA-binding SARP family transcriptional activator